MIKIDDNYIRNIMFGNRQIKSSMLKKYCDISNCNNDLDIQIFNYLKERFNDSDSLKETLIRIKKQIFIKPTCPTCGKKIKFEDSTSSYHRFCSCHCAQLDKDVRLKNENTNMRLYHVKNGYQSESAKLKYRNTCYRTLGRSNYFSGSIGAELAAQGMFRKYKKRNCQQVKEINEKSHDTLERKTGKRYASQNRETRLKSQKRYAYNGLNFDSGLELKYYIYLTDHKIPFIKDPNIQFEYIGTDSKKHIYFPDFKVNNDIIELKGDHFFDKNGKMINPYDRSQDSMYESKHQCMIKNKVIIMKESDCNHIIRYIDNAYGKNYIKKFRK